MTKKLWQKTNIPLHPLIEEYTVGQDYILDQELMLFDIQASQAHVEMLCRINILTDDEKDMLCKGLEQMKQEWKDEKIKITVKDEDCHTVIENYLTEHLGNTGKKIQTGRSRNDQVLVAVRLYMKQKLKTVQDSALKLANILLSYATKYQYIPLPGYTHTQQAMLSSIGHYMAAHVESLLNDIEFLQKISGNIDKNPLGSAAGFGVSIPLDREYTTKKLGFNSIQVNSLYCQNSRGKYESIVMEGLVQIMLTLGKFANDLLIFTSKEFNFFAVEENLVTGSSIMPQKRNLDVMEILRGNVSVVMANQQMIQNICKNLLSGYNRDLQLIKKPFMESFNLVEKSLAVTKLFLNGTKPKQEIIEKKISQDIFLADTANELVKNKNIPFRDAYLQAYQDYEQNKNNSNGSDEKNNANNIDMQKNIKSKQSLGAPGNLGLEMYKEQIEILSQKILS